MERLVVRHVCRSFVVLGVAVSSFAGACTGSIENVNAQDPVSAPRGSFGAPAADKSTGGAPAGGAMGTAAESDKSSLPPGGPGPSPLRRLTREEYNNTIADLLGDDTKPARVFPADVTVHGFDNNAGPQVVTGTQAGDYLQAAEVVAGRAVGKLASLVGCNPAQAGEEACARTFITSFGRRAFRRPLTPLEVTRLLTSYTAGRALDSFQTGIEVAIARILQSPQFLYRVEVGEPAAAGRVRPTSWEMATRLSYFLWASMPDDTLFRAAEANLLLTRDQVAAQTRRMLDSPRAHRMVSRFHEQWLTLGKIDELEKDAKLFPEFKTALRPLFKQETLQLIDDVVWKGDGDLRKLFTADYSFMNKDLATFLGIPGASAMSSAMFSRVQLAPTGPPGTTQRMGVLTQAGLMSAQAKLAETSPVLRGKFVLEQTLCLELPPPPPNVANALPPADPKATTRQRYEQHAKAECASCHRLLDPIGFALENFDAVGRWRSQEGGRPLDVQGVIAGTGDVDGEVVGAIELVRKLASSAQLGKCIARQWFRYAHGRAEVPDDERGIADLAAQLGTKGYSFRELVVAMTQTEAFSYLTRGP